MYDNYSVKCGKLAFPDDYSAEKKIEQREFDEPQWRGQTYQCSVCSKWHITTKNSNTSDDRFVPQSRTARVQNSSKKSSDKRNTVEGSRTVSSYGKDSSGSSIFDSVDEDTLRKLGLL